MRPAFSLAAALLIVMTGMPGRTRSAGARQQPPGRDVPRGYQLVDGFPKLPDGVKLGACAGAATDSRGDVFIFHRAEPPVLVFRPAGEFVRSFGAKLFTSPHGLRVDKDDNVWVTDNAAHTVLKLDRAGRVLLTLGERGVAGEDERHFNKPADVAVAANGDIFVADGYGNSRVVKFDKTGRFLRAWGRKGMGPGEFNLPHAVRLDSTGRVYVGDRENNRVQVFEPDGTFVRQFAQGIAPFGLFITDDDTLFVADGRANRVVKMSLEGKVLAAWGHTGAGPGEFRMPHGITVGRDGAVYVTEIDGKRVQKFVPVAQPDAARPGGQGTN
jgi:DNA-binding beta-propeller fold protein YncE